MCLICSPCFVSSIVGAPRWPSFAARRGSRRLPRRSPSSLVFLAMPLCRPCRPASQIPSSKHRHNPLRPPGQLFHLLVQLQFHQPLKTGICTTEQRSNFHFIWNFSCLQRVLEFYLFTLITYITYQISLTLYKIKYVPIWRLGCTQFLKHQIKCNTHTKQINIYSTIYSTYIYVFK